MKLPLLAVLVLSLPVFAGWRWDADEGFVEDPAVVAPGSPSTAEDYAAAGQFGRAAARYRLLAEAAGDDTAVKRVAWLKCGDARILIQSWADAYDAYENYLALVETHAEHMRGARFQVEACIMGVENGAGFDFFGLIRGSQWASKRGRELLTIYAYEDWSASARLRFAGSLLAADRFDEAIIEYEFLLTDLSPDSPWKPNARLRKAEAHLSQFAGMSYDPQPLEEARREFRRYLDDYPNGDKRDQAKARLEDLDALQAEKDWKTYEHYRHVRKWRSARLYLKEIVRKYPATKWAEDAKEELPGLEKRISGMEPQDREQDK